MPRKRTSTTPPKLRTKLDTAGQINDELRRTYRLFINKQVTHAEMSRRRELLVALRGGLPEPVEQPKPANSGWTSPPVILSVPSDRFFSLEQIAKMKRGEDVIDIAQCTPVALDELETNAAPGPFPRLVHLEESNHESPTPEEARLIAELSSMHRQLMDLAIARGLVDPGSPGSSDGDDAA